MIPWKHYRARHGAFPLLLTCLLFVFQLSWITAQEQSHVELGTTRTTQDQGELSDPISPQNNNDIVLGRRQQHPDGGSDKIQPLTANKSGHDDNTAAPTSEGCDAVGGHDRRTMTKQESQTKNGLNSHEGNVARHLHDQASIGDDSASTTGGEELVPADCTVVMAPSSIPDAGWGIFTMTSRKRGDPILDGDVVHQLSDLNLLAAASLKSMLHDYLWSVQETGGYYEGLNVVSVLPGIGMLANGLPPPYHNVLPFVPRVDEGGLTRQSSPGAGAITHYHNYTFYAQKNIAAGGEIFVNYGSDWFQERNESLTLELLQHSDGPINITKSLDWLRRNGMCLDHLRPYRSQIPNVGRGVVAKRHLPSGSLVAPVPVLPLHRMALRIKRLKKDGTSVDLEQLILNYCFGHENSSLLLYPYGPLVNLINHEPPYSNVKLQWSRKQPHNVLQRPIQDLDQSPMLLELRATRDIQTHEEILLDYGAAWSAAWQHHVERWQPPPNAQTYAPSYVHEDAIRALRIESELQDHPYPDNIFTSCFYRYSDHANQSKASMSKQASTSATGKKEDTVVTVQWKQTRGIYELSNLRPCRLLQRENHNKKEGTVFTVQIRNRGQLPMLEVIPKGTVHIVTRVPRQAIRFSDKIYTTDQHLENAFRHEIGFQDFPEAWLDLLPDEASSEHTEL